jgi:hypothetical protein
LLPKNPKTPFPDDGRNWNEDVNSFWNPLCCFLRNLAELFESGLVFAVALRSSLAFEDKLSKCKVLNAVQNHKLWILQICSQLVLNLVKLSLGKPLFLGQLQTPFFTGIWKSRLNGSYRSEFVSRTTPNYPVDQYFGWRFLRLHQQLAVRWVKYLAFCSIPSLLTCCFKISKLMCWSSTISTRSSSFKVFDTGVCYSSDWIT